MKVSTHLLRHGLVALSALVLACGAEAPESQPEEATADGTVRLSEAQVRAAEIVTAKVRMDTIRREVRVPGSVHSPDTSHAVIGSIVEGQIVAVRVLPGDVVERGRSLIEIHSHELAAAQRDLTAAQAGLEFHTNALARSEKLFEAGAVALEEVERRSADFRAAEGELRRAEEMVEHLHPSADGGVRSLAPQDGTVFAVLARPGQAVVPGTPLVEMGSTDVLWVTAFVPEHTASSLTVGDVVHVGFRSPPVSSTARLVRMGNYVDAANRSIEMRFELDSIPRGIRHGSFAAVDIASSELFEGAELDEQAAVRIGEEDVVFVVEGEGLYRPVVVSVASIREGRIAVQGIPPGAEIVVQGAYFLKAALEVGEGAGDES